MFRNYTTIPFDNNTDILTTDPQYNDESPVLWDTILGVISCILLVVLICTYICTIYCKNIPERDSQVSPTICDRVTDFVSQCCMLPCNALSILCNDNPLQCFSHNHTSPEENQTTSTTIPV